MWRIRSITRELHKKKCKENSISYSSKIHWFHKSNAYNNQDSFFTCIPTRYHTKRRASQSCRSKQCQPWHQKCLTCEKKRRQMIIKTKFTSSCNNCTRNIALFNSTDLLSPTKSVDTTSSSVYPRIPFSLPSDSSLVSKQEIHLSIILQTLPFFWQIGKFLLDRSLYVFVGGLLFKPNGKVDNGDINSGNTEWHSCQLTV